MYGEAGHKLVQHAKRAQALPVIPPYQADLVRLSVRETRALHASTQALRTALNEASSAAPLAATTTRLLVEYLCMRRNKRCLLAYHRQRLDRVAELVWKGIDLEGAGAGDGEGEREVQDGGASRQEHDRGQTRGQGGGNNNNNNSSSGSGGEKGNSLSPEEEEYARAYAELLASYKGQWTDIDLTGSLEPPRDLFIDVRVLRDAGEIQTEYGAINLTKNSQFYVRQGDVERLVQQGYLQKIS